MNDNDLLVRMMADATQYQRTIGEASRSLDNFAAHATAVGKVISVPFYVAAAGITAVSVASAAAIANSVKLAASYEQVTASFTLMVGGADKAKKMLAEIDEFAISSPFKSAELTNSAKKLKSFGVDNDSVLPMLKSIGEVTSGTGGGQDVFDRITVALGQVKTAGRLTGAELLQFTNANVPMIEYLAQVLKKPTSSIKMMIEEGKIGYPQVLEAFNKMTHGAGVFAGQMDAQAKTVKGRWDALDETFQVMQRDFGEGFNKGFRVAELLEDFGKWVTAMREGGTGIAFLDQTTEQFFANLRTGFDDMVAYGSIVKSFVIYNKEWIIVLLKLAGILIAVHVAIILINGALAIMAPIVAVAKLLWAGFTLAMAAYNVMTSLATLTTIALTVAVYALEIAIAVVVAALLAGVAVAGYFVLEWTGALKNLDETLSKQFGEITKSFGESWQGIKDAMAIGDWDMVGNIIKKTLEVAWSGMIVSLKVMWLDFTTWMTTNLADIGYRIKLEVVNSQEYLALMANKPMNALGGGEVRDAATKTEYDVKRSEVKKQRDDVQGDLKRTYNTDKIEIEAPFKQLQSELTAMVGVAKSNRNEADPVFKAVRSSDAFQKAFDPAEAAGEQMASDAKIELRGTARYMMDGFGGAIQSSWQQVVMPILGDNLHEMGEKEVAVNRTLLRMAASVAASFTGAGNVGKAVSQGTIRQNEDIPIPLQISGEALKLSQGIQKEMLTGGKGQFGGEEFNQFKKNMGLLNEARDGFFGDSFGGMFKGTGGVINDKEKQYGQNEEYAKLQKFVGKREMVQPPTMYRGDVNTQDAINKATMEGQFGKNNDPQLEILETLKAAEELQKEQRDYAKRTAEALDELAKNGLLKAGDMNK